MKGKYQNALCKGVEMQKWLVSGSLVQTTGEKNMPVALTQII
jgi:hypothetical protein